MSDPGRHKAADATVKAAQIIAIAADLVMAVSTIVSFAMMMWGWLRRRKKER